MNHKWKKKDNKTSICKTCGCIKDVLYGVVMYSRSEIVFAEKRPDCIDWKIENNKTID